MKKDRLTEIKDKVLARVAYHGYVDDNNLFEVRQKIAGDWFDGVFHGYELDEVLRVFDALY